MTPGSLVRIVDPHRWGGLWVGLPNGEEEWIKAPFLTAVLVGPTTSKHWRPPSIAVPERANQDILYGDRIIIVRSDVIREVQS